MVYMFSYCLCRFSLALFEAVDQCNDAVQITGKDSSIMASLLLYHVKVDDDTCVLLTPTVC